MVFCALEEGRASYVSPVSFGRKIMGKAVSKAATRGNLSYLETRQDRELVRAAMEVNISPVVFKIVQTDYFVVVNARPRSIDHNWAHVKSFRGKGAERSKGISSLLQGRERLMYEMGQNRSRCLNARIVVMQTIS